MDLWGALILVGFFLVFGLLVFAAYHSSRKDKEEKRRVWQQLGFTAIEADALLAEKIFSLYRREGISNRYELRNLSRKAILDGEIPNEHDAALAFLMKIKDGTLSRPPK